MPPIARQEVEAVTLGERRVAQEGDRVPADNGTRLGERADARRQSRAGGVRAQPLHTLPVSVSSLSPPSPLEPGGPVAFALLVLPGRAQVDMPARGFEVERGIA